MCRRRLWLRHGRVVASELGNVYLPVFADSWGILAFRARSVSSMELNGGEMVAGHGRASIQCWGGFRLEMHPLQATLIAEPKHEQQLKFNERTYVRCSASALHR